MNAAPLVPFETEWHRLHGLCRCGCGGKTNIAPQALTSGGRRLQKGDHYDYINGHFMSKNRPLYTEDPETGCWNWLRYVEPDGYGRYHADGEQLAHRVFYRRAHGGKPVGILDHLCRNRRCVNPAHLEPVSNAENIRRSTNTKLTWDDVREIRTSSDRGIDLAERYGVSSAAISAIRKHKIWREDCHGPDGAPDGATS